jgi:hypothetical protein
MHIHKYALIFVVAAFLENITQIEGFSIDINAEMFLSG